MPIFLPINADLRRVGDEGHQGTFDVMKEFFGLMRGGISVARLVLVLIFAASWSLQAQTAPPEQQGPPIIKSIEIQYVGPQTIAREKILAQMQSKPGRPYSESLVEQDIKALYKTGQLQNVRIFGQAEGDGVKVMVVLQTRSFVNEIAIEGAERISAKSLRKKIDLKFHSRVAVCGDIRTSL